MKTVLFTKDSESAASITVTLRRLIDSGVVKPYVALNAYKGEFLKLTLEDKYGNKERVTFIVNRSQLQGAKTTTLRSLTSFSSLANKPKVGRPTEYTVSRAK